MRSPFPTAIYAYLHCVHIGSEIYIIIHIAARRFRAIRYANRAKKIVTKAVEVRVERPPPTMHEALRDIRELKVLYATLTYDNSRVHTRLIEMHARP